MDDIEKENNEAKNMLLRAYSKFTQDQAKKIADLEQALDVTITAFSILVDKLVTGQRRKGYSICDFCNFELCNKERSCRESITAYTIAQAKEFIMLEGKKK